VSPFGEFDAVPPKRWTTLPSLPRLPLDPDLRPQDVALHEPLADSSRRHDDRHLGIGTRRQASWLSGVPSAPMAITESLP
jgi:hypothetical protein